MKIKLDLNSLEDYRLFLKVKSLPIYSFTGRMAEFPDEYADRLGIKASRKSNGKYASPDWMFDYQGDISALAIRKQKFAVFADCGLGKTAILLEFAKHAASQLKGQKVLIVSPLMVIRQTLAECARFYGMDLEIDQVRAAGLNEWLATNKRGSAKIGITNYEAITDSIERGKLGALILDESSMLKSHYGKWGTRIIELGKGLDWKLCLTGTPAPNDRIEYANHAVFLDHFPTVNSFLAKYFVNRGDTSNRWELKHHALGAFYTGLSHWCIFLTNPATYGWKDNVEPVPPINVHIEDIELTDDQRQLVAKAGGDMFGTPGGITSRAKLSQLAKGRSNGERVETLKPAFIRRLVESFKGESTLIWCQYNHEQEQLEKELPYAGSISGVTPQYKRDELIAAFQAGTLDTIITKAKVMGFGLNLQICTRQVFSGLMDSYETYYQAVKRSNRYGSTKPLHVHIPVTEIERPMVDNVLRKARMVQHDTEEQERIFKGFSHVSDSDLCKRS